ncbi:MAG: hypothetical protein C4297_01825 [Gemmataceae bacterium]
MTACIFLARRKISQVAELPLVKRDRTVGASCCALLELNACIRRRHRLTAACCTRQRRDTGRITVKELPKRHLFLSTTIWTPFPAILTVHSMRRKEWLFARKPFMRKTLVGCLRQRYTICKRSILGKNAAFWRRVMSLWTWRPGWDPFGELQRQVDRLFDLTIRQFWQTDRPYPPLNLYETGAEYVLVASVPGARPEDIELSVLGDTLILRGERRVRQNVAEDAYRRQERWYGKWSRSVQLPEQADANQIGATLEHGLLVVRIPKAAQAVARQIPIRVRDGRPEPEGG